MVPIEESRAKLHEVDVTRLIQVGLDNLLFDGNGADRVNRVNTRTIVTEITDRVSFFVEIRIKASDCSFDHLFVHNSGYVFARFITNTVDYIHTLFPGCKRKDLSKGMRDG